ncbi:MAG: hypothetical protein IPK82_08070 [Polyangiaceae bacterium]|nr:hypothetical protein [Polyangiaceae bacterium]
MNRRTFLAVSVAAAYTLSAGIVYAGSYLDRAALMLEEGRKEIETVKTRTNDKELLIVVRALTEARLKVARKMNVPAQVVSAHPHLMLVLENYDRAIESLLASNTKKYAECLVNAADEEKTFRSMIKEAGYSLPKL